MAFFRLPCQPLYSKPRAWLYLCQGCIFHFSGFSIFSGSVAEMFIDTRGITFNILRIQREWRRNPLSLASVYFCTCVYTMLILSCHEDFSRTFPLTVSLRLEWLKHFKLSSSCYKSYYTYCSLIIVLMLRNKLIKFFGWIKSNSPFYCIHFLYLYIYLKHWMWSFSWLTYCYVSYMQIIKCWTIIKTWN